MRKSTVDEIILKILSKECMHQTSQQIYSETKLILPAVNQSTVYRSLSRLVNNKLVSVSDMGTGSAVYELISNHPHHHLVCQQCKQIFTISSDQVQKFFDTIENQYEFQIETNHLILFGICKDCLKLKNPEQ